MCFKLTDLPHRRLYTHKGLLAATSNALLLQKCLKQRLWDTTHFECRQARLMIPYGTRQAVGIALAIGVLATPSSLRTCAA